MYVTEWIWKMMAVGETEVLTLFKDKLGGKDK
jgi:hypothetical protein